LEGNLVEDPPLLEEELAESTLALLEGKLNELLACLALLEVVELDLEGWAVLEK
jgi:hypothetical protein